MNAGRNTYLPVPLPPTTTSQDELADETQDSERRFIDHIHLYGIRLADYQDKPSLPTSPQPTTTPTALEALRRCPRASPTSSSTVHPCTPGQRTRV
jgi:hypothetical protein